MNRLIAIFFPALLAISGCAMLEDKLGFNVTDQAEIARITANTNIHHGATSSDRIRRADNVISLADKIDSLAEAGVSGDLILTGLNQWIDAQDFDDYDKSNYRSLATIATSRIKDVNVISEKDVEYLKAVAQAIREAGLEAKRIEGG